MQQNLDSNSGFSLMYLENILLVTLIIKEQKKNDGNKYTGLNFITCTMSQHKHTSTCMSNISRNIECELACNHRLLPSRKLQSIIILRFLCPAGLAMFVDPIHFLLCSCLHPCCFDYFLVLKKVLSICGCSFLKYRASSPSFRISH